MPMSFGVRGDGDGRQVDDALCRGGGGRAARVGLGGGGDHGAGAQGEDDGGGQREEVLGVHCHASVVMLWGGVVVR